MGWYPKEFQRFDTMMKQVLAVPRATLEDRVARYLDASKKKPRRPGPKPKSMRA